MTTTKDPLLRDVRRIAVRHRKNGAELHAAIRAAHAAGHTYRAVAEQAGVSHVTIINIVKAEEEVPS